MESIALFEVCAWPNCERTEIFTRGLCRRCHMRVLRAGTLNQYSAPPRICLHCLGMFVTGSRAFNRYCSDECRVAYASAEVSRRRARARRGRTCPECGGAVPNTVRKDGRYCSVACQKGAWYRANEEHCRANAIDWNRAHPEQKRAASKAWYERNAERARELSRAWRAANIELCRALSRRQSALRRAQIYGVHYEHVTLAELWERDEGICWLCKDSVDATLTWPHPLSVSVDHVIPLSKGGVHAAQNLAIAHLVCNLRKGTKLITQE